MPLQGLTWTTIINYQRPMSRLFLLVPGSAKFNIKVTANIDVSSLPGLIATFFLLSKEKNPAVFLLVRATNPIHEGSALKTQ